MDKLRLPWDRYLAALKRLLELIKGGEPLVYWDCSAIGAKETHCSWGMCSTDAKAWPDAEDHMWPDEFRKRGRVAPRHTSKDQMCPFNKRTEGNSFGCFYSCRFFSSPRSQVPNRDEAIALMQTTITRVKNKWMNRVRKVQS